MNREHNIGKNLIVTNISMCSYNLFTLTHIQTKYCGMILHCTVPYCYIITISGMNIAIIIIIMLVSCYVYCVQLCWVHNLSLHTLRTLHGGSVIIESRMAPLCLQPLTLSTPENQKNGLTGNHGPLSRIGPQGRGCRKISQHTNVLFRWSRGSTGIHKHRRWGTESVCYSPKEYFKVCKYVIYNWCMLQLLKSAPRETAEQYIIVRHRG